MRCTVRVVGLLVGSLLALTTAACEPALGIDEGVCPVSEAPPTGAHRLFLSFDGMSVHPGADDARLDRSHLAVAEAIVPPFAGDPAARAAIVASVQASLAPFDVEVVTSRPDSGSYDMIVFGGQSDKVLGQGGLQFALPEECNGNADSQVAFVFDVHKPLEAIASSTVGIYAVMHGASTTANPGDCLCLTDSKCTASGKRCTFTTNAVGSTASRCRPSSHVNSGQQMAIAFGCRE
jgi:hypothetical protein